MKKDIIITCRISEKTYKRINNIKKQLIEKGFNEEDMTISFIIREAIRILDEKAQYFIWEK